MLCGLHKYGCRRKCYINVFFPLIEIEMCKSKYFLEYCNCVLLKKCCKFILCISYINIFLKGNSYKTAYLHFILHFVCLCFFETIFLCCPDWPQTPVFLSHLPESWAHRYSHIYTLFPLVFFPPCSWFLLSPVLHVSHCLSPTR